MSAVMGSELAERGTGTGLYDWLRTQLADFQSRTAQPLPARIIYFGPSFLVEAAQGDLIEQMESITDPNAQKRFIGHGITEMAHTLSQFAFAARLVIPGLRDMTPAELENLRQYYKRFYRKA
jgi:hypothetical protein